ncbi:MAG: DUF2285 domain-containing protein [Acidobacteria bacterium]|nr:DUF2285 domain-containing protein [Acidobacteriota bacterium]
MTVLPAVVPLTPVSTEFDLSRTRPVQFQRHWTAARTDDELHLLCNGSVLRVHALRDLDGQTVCAVLPLDALFEVRLKSARWLWRAAKGRNAGPDPSAFSKTQRDRLVKGLRGLDGRLEGATYREIAAVLFGTHRLPERSWKTHDLRDRTIRLCKFAADLMQGDYRQLLLHPYRQRLY